jgi:RNA polymerase sigma factor (sigma-70 family)
MSQLNTEQMTPCRAEVAAAVDDCRTRGRLAFGQLWALVEGKVCKTVEYYIKHAEVRDDLRQEIALKFLERVLDRDEPIHDAEAYVRMIARNECMNYFRARKHDPLRSPAELSEFNEPASREIGDELDAIAEMVNDMIKPLSDKSKEILSQRFWQDQSAKDIGENLNVGERRVHQILQGILGTLKRFLNGDKR